MRLFGPRYPELRRVIVNTRSGRTFQGVLAIRRRDYVVLRVAKMVAEAGQVVPLDGEVMIEAANLDFMQVL